MNTPRQTRLVHEGDLLAEVEVTLFEDEAGWAPYLSVEDALRLDDVREALRRQDLVAATKLARIFRLMPVTAA